MSASALGTWPCFTPRGSCPTRKRLFAARVSSPCPSTIATPVSINSSIYGKALGVDRLETLRHAGPLTCKAPRRSARLTSCTASRHFDIPSQRRARG